MFRKVVKKLKKEDRRVRKTKKALKDGMMTLLKDKKVNDISVKELTDFVDIHRGTFYIHYKDIYDLYKDIEEELFFAIDKIFQDHSPIHSEETLFETLLTFNEFVYNRLESCNTFLNSPTGFDKRLIHHLQKEYVETFITSTWNNVKEEDLSYICDYIISGCMAITNRWIIEGKKNSPEEITKKMIDISLNGLECLNSNNN